MGQRMFEKLGHEISNQSTIVDPNGSQS